MAATSATVALYWFIAFSGAAGSSPADMRPGMAVGPFPLEECYRAAGTILAELKRGFPSEDFAGACWTEKVVGRRPGMEILDAAGFRSRWEALR